MAIFSGSPVFASRSPRGRGAMVLLMATTFLTGFATISDSLAVEAKIMVQMDNYKGDEAYFALYLVNPEGRYERTLWVSGDNEKYHPDMPRWWKYLARKPQEIDAITGASTAAGDRSVIDVEFADELIDAGYRLRVETSVEDQTSYPADVEADLSSAAAGEKIPGTGYVRFIRFKL